MSMEQAPQLNRKELADKLKDIRKSDPENPEKAHAKARGYLEAKKEIPEYKDSAGANAIQRKERVAKIKDEIIKKNKEEQQQKEKLLRQAFLNRNVMVAYRLVDESSYGYEGDGKIFESEIEASQEGHENYMNNLRGASGRGLQVFRPVITEVEKPRRKPLKIRTREGIWTDWGGDGN